MLRKLLYALVAVGGLVLSGTAWAIMTDVNLTSNGNPVPSQTVTLTVRTPGKPTRTLTVKTSKTSKIKLRITETNINETTVDISLSSGGYKTNVPLSQLTGGGEIDVPGNTPGTPATYMPDSPFTPFYLGGGVGVQWTTCADVQTTLLQSAPTGGADPLGPENTACLSSAFHGSIYGGYNLMLASKWLAGIEVDFGFSSHNKTTSGIPGTVGSIVTAAASANDSTNLKQNWDFGLRSRFGYFVTPSTMLFGTGGIAFTEAQLTINCTATGACGANGLPAFTASNSKLMTGWALGVGLETKLAKNWLGRAEYRYTDYGTFTAIYGNPVVIAPTMAVHLRNNLLSLGAAYQFGGAN
jgi:outer membrane immunogenic protein